MKPDASVGGVMKEFQVEAAKALPAVSGVAIYGFTLNEMVAVATLAYVILQSAYLIWKWIKEARKA